jgi:hypothetical protein
MKCRSHLAVTSTNITALDPPCSAHFRAINTISTSQNFCSETVT